MSVGLAEIESTDILGSMFSPIGFAEERAIDRIQTSLAEIAQKIAAQIEDIAIHVMDSPTVEDFEAIRKSVFPSYVELLQAFSHIVLAKLDKAELPGLIDASFGALEAEIESKAASCFGEDAYREILFSIGTLKRAYRWIPYLWSNRPEEKLRRKDAELAHDFNLASWWSNFHLEVLRTALRKNQTIIPEVLQELLDGLRMSVMAYSYVREALDLRNIPDVHQVEELDVSWDAEDEALANAD